MKKAAATQELDREREELKALEHLVSLHEESRTAMDMMSEARWLGASFLLQAQS